MAEQASTTSSGDQPPMWSAAFPVPENDWLFCLVENKSGNCDILLQSNDPEDDTPSRLLGEFNVDVDTAMRLMIVLIAGSDMDTQILTNNDPAEREKWLAELSE